LKILDSRLQVSSFKFQVSGFKLKRKKRGNGEWGKITLCKRQKLFCSMVRMETILTINDMRIFPMHLIRIYISLILWKIKLSTNVKSFYEEAGILLKKDELFSKKTIPGWHREIQTSRLHYIKFSINHYSLS
jgi:hypothetical protein